MFVEYVFFLSQDDLWDQYVKELERKAANSDQVNCNSVTIYCKNCDQKLCLGSDLRKKGSHYIADEKNLQDKVTVKEKEKQMDYRYDTHIGNFLARLLDCVSRANAMVQASVVHPSSVKWKVDIHRPDPLDLQTIFFPIFKFWMFIFFHFHSKCSHTYNSLFT